MSRRFRPVHWVARSVSITMHMAGGPARAMRRWRVSSAERHQRSFTGKLKGLGALLRIHPETFLAQAYVDGSYELPLVRYLTKVLHPGMCCIDGGANIGFFTLVMAHGVTRSGKVIAFEPTRGTHILLRENIEMNFADNVVAECLALSDREGELRFHEGPPGFDVYNSAGEISHPMAAGREFRTVAVPCTTVDAYLRRTGITSVDVVKLDVEGSELFALRGMEETVEANPRMKILVELADQTTAGFGYRAREIQEWLVRHGFRLGLIETRGNLVPATAREDWNGEMIVAYRD